MNIILMFFAIFRIFDRGPLFPGLGIETNDMKLASGRLLRGESSIANTHFKKVHFHDDDNHGKIN